MQHRQSPLKTVKSRRLMKRYHLTTSGRRLKSWGWALQLESLLIFDSSIPVLTGSAQRMHRASLCVFCTCVLYRWVCKLYNCARGLGKNGSIFLYRWNLSRMLLTSFSWRGSCRQSAIVSTHLLFFHITTFFLEILCTMKMKVCRAGSFPFCYCCM